ncbi:MAG: hypothetical protein H0V50_07475 [Thermoleophilaceae bacterium]|nr:hypothetical protein [Thermoleophilaceae bacterium]
MRTTCAAKTNVRFTEAHLSLRNGDFERAEMQLHDCTKEKRANTHPRPEVGELALRLQLNLSKFEKPTPGELAELERLHKLTRTLSSQDLVMIGMHRALNSVGQIEKAQKLVQDYVGMYRRERGALNPELQDIIGEASQEQSLTKFAH